MYLKHLAMVEIYVEKRIFVYIVDGIFFFTRLLLNYFVLFNINRINHCTKGKTLADRRN